jgi:hypothetical protein
MAIDWIKKWDATDVGRHITGRHLRLLQDDIDAGFEQALDAGLITVPSQTGHANSIMTTDGVTGDWGWPVLDEDDMASDSAVSLATQQSIKAYIDGLGLTTQFKAGSITRGLSSSSGDVTYTGVGFTSRAILFYASEGTSNYLMFGATSGAGQDVCIRVVLPFLSARSFKDTHTDHCIDLRNPNSVGQTGVLSAFTADGFTITWTKVGSTSGTVVINALCFA